MSTSASSPPPPALQSLDAVLSDSPPQQTQAQPNITTPNPLHDDNTSQLEPPHRPYASEAPSPQSASLSARTSFTRVDLSAEDEAPRSTMSQDPQSTPGPSLEQGSSEQPQSHALEVQTDNVGAAADSAPAATGTTVNDESTQKSSQQEAAVPQTPQAFLTFLLVSGKRRTMSFEPETTIGRVKELIWNAWPSEWQGECPPTPAYLRILYLGKMLQDDDTLTKLKMGSSLPNAPQPTIVHLSIRPYHMSAEESAIKKKRKTNEALDTTDGADARSGCCGCIIC